MAYVKTVWETGDVITAEKLNKAEKGIADNSTTWVTVSGSASSVNVDKTPAEIFDACSNGLVFARFLDHNNEPDGRIGYVLSGSETNCVILFPATDIYTGLEFGPFDHYFYDVNTSSWRWSAYGFKMYALE